MDSAGALRQARAAWLLATSKGTDPNEAEQARRMVEHLIRKHKLSRREVTEGEDPRAAGGIDALPIGPWQPEYMELIAAVIGLAGGAMERDMLGNAWLAGPRIALPRLRSLADRLIYLYRTEGEKIEAKFAELDEMYAQMRRSFDWGSDVFATPAPKSRNAEKVSLWVGLTMRLVERLQQPAPRPDRTSTALAVIPWQLRQGAAGGGARGGGSATEGRSYRVASNAEFEAGRRLADSVLLGEEAAKLAPPARRIGQHRREDDNSSTDQSKTVASVDRLGLNLESGETRCPAKPSRPAAQR